MERLPRARSERRKGGRQKNVREARARESAKGRSRCTRRECTRRKKPCRRSLPRGLNPEFPDSGQQTSGATFSRRGISTETIDTFLFLLFRRPRCLHPRIGCTACRRALAARVLDAFRAWREQMFAARRDVQVRARQRKEKKWISRPGGPTKDQDTRRRPLWVFLSPATHSQHRPRVRDRLARRPMRLRRRIH